MVSKFKEQKENFVNQSWVGKVYFTYCQFRETNLSTTKIKGIETRDKFIGL